MVNKKIIGLLVGTLLAGCTADAIIHNLTKEAPIYEPVSIMVADSITNGKQAKLEQKLIKAINDAIFEEASKGFRYCRVQHYEYPEGAANAVMQKYTALGYKVEKYTLHVLIQW